MALDARPRREPWAKRRVTTPQKLAFADREIHMDVKSDKCVKRTLPNFFRGVSLPH